MLPANKKSENQNIEEKQNTTYMQCGETRTKRNGI